MHTSLIGLMVTGTYTAYEGEVPNHTLRKERTTGTVVGIFDVRIYVMSEDGVIRNCEVNDMKVHDPKEYVRRINGNSAGSSHGWTSDSEGNYYKGKYAVTMHNFKEKWEILLIDVGHVGWAPTLDVAKEIVDNLILEGNGAE